MDTNTKTVHRRTQAVALGYKRDVCAECGTDWPCAEIVKKRCEETMAEGIDCTCGWHKEAS